MKFCKNNQLIMVPSIGLFCLLLSFQLFAQCSTAAWSSVTGTIQAIGSSTAPVGKQYEGQCGLTVNATTAPGFVTATFSGSETVFTTRFYILAENLNISSGDVIIFRAKDNGTTQVELRLREISNVLHLVARSRSDGSLTQTGQPIPLLAVWQAIAFSWSAGAGNGEFSLELDQVQQFSFTDLNNGSEVINKVDLGITNTPAASGKIVIDAFESRNTATLPSLLAIDELINISTRANIISGDEIVIGGFIISGDTEKCVVVRGRGQSVGVPAGVTQLADPILTLKSGPTTVDTSDDWGNHPTAAIVSQLGRAPTAPSDAALYACLAPGAYTALVRGVSGTTKGVGIVEVFDEDNSTPFLSNISTRAPVGTANEVAIGGFVVRGQLPKQVLIRGRGPTVGVPPGNIRLANPTLTLKSGSTTLATNDNWQDAANSADILATGNAPVNPLEAAILISIPAGSYTAILRGVAGSTGIGIVEVLDQSGGKIELN